MAVCGEKSRPLSETVSLGALFQQKKSCHDADIAAGVIEAGGRMDEKFVKKQKKHNFSDYFLHFCR